MLLDALFGWLDVFPAMELLDMTAKQSPVFQPQVQGRVHWYTSARVCFPTDQGELGGGSLPIETAGNVTCCSPAKFTLVSPPVCWKTNPGRRVVVYFVH